MMMAAPRSLPTPLIICKALVIKLVCLLLLLPASAQSHNLAPGLMNIHMLDDYSADIRWKTTNVQSAGVDLMPVFPDNCQAVTDKRVTLEGPAVIYSWKTRCDQPLINQQIHFADLERSGSNVMVVYSDVSGRSDSRLIHDKNPFYEVPEALSLTDTIREYLLSGIEHLVFGPDHVLFVFGLLILLYGNLRILIVAITSFTFGHSISLGLASLGYVNFNVQLVEIFIAITLFILALEILRPDNFKQAWSIRHKPYVLTFVFGLIHGFGFASVLADALTREGDLVIPLLAFNIGIEVGQLMIVLATLIILRLLMIPDFRVKTQTASMMTAYPIGILSCYWIIDRLLW